jgi:hypothetical protein
MHGSRETTLGSSGLSGWAIRSNPSRDVLGQLSHHTGAAIPRASAACQRAQASLDLYKDHPGAWCEAKITKCT